MRHRDNARIEHDKALARVMTALLCDDTELFKQFSDSASLKRWLTDTIFSNHVRVARHARWLCCPYDSSSRPKGQVVIPKDMRDAIGLRPGDDVELTLESGGVRVVPARPLRTRAGLLVGHRLVDALESEHRVAGR